MFCYMWDYILSAETQVCVGFLHRQPFSEKTDTSTHTHVNVQRILKYYCKHFLSTLVIEYHPEQNLIAQLAPLKWKPNVVVFPRIDVRRRRRNDFFSLTSQFVRL